MFDIFMNSNRENTKCSNYWFGICLPVKVAVSKSVMCPLSY